MKSRPQIDEQCLQDIFTLVDECNPFDPENQNLWTLQRGAYASEELINGFESAYENGDALVQDSINIRLTLNPSHYLFHTQSTTGKHS